MVRHIGMRSIAPRRL